MRHWAGDYGTLKTFPEEGKIFRQKNKKLLQKKWKFSQKKKCRPQINKKFSIW
jgi:hypothetical protein